MNPTGTQSLLPNERPRSLCVILNERASTDPDLQTALDHARASGYTVEVQPIREPGEGIRFAADAARKGTGIVVAAGGDGTINEVVNGVLQSADAAVCAVGTIPFGTANDFAAMSGIPVDKPIEALRLVMESEPILIDVGKMDDRLFINVASGGFGAEVTAETKPEIKGVLGGLAYLLTGLANVRNISARHVHIVAQNFTWDDPALAVSVGNGRQAGGGFQVCPNALLDDGLLDVLIIPDVPQERLIALARDLMRLGKQTDHEHLIYLQVPWLEVRARDGLRVNLDGQPFHGESFHFGILNRKLPFYLGPTAPLKNTDQK